MDTLQVLWSGWLHALEPGYVLWAFAGSVVGTLIGVIPGFGPSVAIALMLPMTWHLGIAPSMIFFIAIACGAMYGGSTASILRNTPGERASMVTSLEGSLMARHGRAGVALATAAIGSFVAGILAAVVVVWLAPWAARIAQRLGPAEYFMLMLMALGAVIVALGRSTLRGVTALALGIALSCVGLESYSGVVRWTGGWEVVADGIDIMLVALGLFVMGEVLHAALYGRAPQSRLSSIGRVHLEPQDWKRSAPAWLRGTALGLPLGCVPVGGVEMPTYVSYATERYVARPRYKAEFGSEGAIEGVAGPEAANNAAVTTALIPLLTMGIPTSNTTAMMLGAFHSYGLHPGPQLFGQGHLLVWTLLASMLVSNIFLLVLNFPLVRVWSWVLRIPRAQIYVCMLLLATAGVYSMRQSGWDLLLFYGFGLLGVLMRRFDFPMTPLLIGFAMGPLAETQLRSAVAVGHGSFSIFVTRPWSLALLVILVLQVLMPRVLQGWAKHRIAQVRKDQQQEDVLN